MRSSAVVSGGILPLSQYGTVRTQYMHMCDWYATLSILGGSDASDHVDGLPEVDGLDMWPMLSGANLTNVRNEVDRQDW